MALEEIRESYYGAVYDTDRKAAMEIVDGALEGGLSAEVLVFDVVLPTMERMVNELAENDEATLAQHFVASKVAADIVENLIPLFAKAPRGSGTVVLGTARGDFHGLGKRIVGGYLTANLFTVHDLGMNVAPEKFVDEAVRVKADVIGVSAMMMHTAVGEEGASAVRRVLEERNLSGKIRLVVGGAPYRFDDALYRRVNADAWAPNALSAVAVLTRQIEEATHV